ncbi:hypothetical protein AMTR_s00008p00137400 [Amborella trichopoda]|uniref:Uncharacterized protein n=1 Tax=Amborella trichopoda TaxID=13333 RepID=W1NHP9_AMBTC|nr:hypothetical protein AMTR_s00008p00137400 [Amborella trichopoda]
MSALLKESALAVKNVESERVLYQNVGMKLKCYVRNVEEKRWENVKIMDEVLTGKLYRDIFQRMEELEVEEGLRILSQGMRGFKNKKRKKRIEEVCIAGELSEENKMGTMTMKEDEFAEPNKKKLRMLHHFEEGVFKSFNEIGGEEKREVQGDFRSTEKQRFDYCAFGSQPPLVYSSC